MGLLKARGWDDIVSFSSSPSTRCVVISSSPIGGEIVGPVVDWSEGQHIVVGDQVRSGIGYDESGCGIEILPGREDFYIISRTIRTQISSQVQRQGSHIPDGGIRCASVGADIGDIYVGQNSVASRIRVVGIIDRSEIHIGSEVQIRSIDIDDIGVVGAIASGVVGFRLESPVVEYVETEFE
jgi:hypothetical protein